MILINGYVFGQDRFYNHEVNFKNVKIDAFKNNVELVFEDNSDIANLTFAVKYIRSINKYSDVYLTMKYIPYSRMDRKINNQVFSMELFAGIINDMEFSKVYVLDPHSEVSVSMINNVEVLDMNRYVQLVLKLYNADVLFFPDKGANSKYPSLLEDNGKLSMYGNKKRDLENKGKIIEYSLCENHPDITGKNVLIIDDLCSGGGTFMLAAKALKDAGASEVRLYVTHCENGIFFGDLLKGELVDHVYTCGTTPLKETSSKLMILPDLTNYEKERKYTE